MSIKRIATNPILSGAVVHNGVVHLAGQVAEGAPGGTIAAQTKDILARIDALLKQAGSDKSKILSATIWLADIRTRDEFNKEWTAWIPAGQTPARACIEAKLASTAYTVEVAVVAAVG